MHYATSRGRSRETAKPQFDNAVGDLVEHIIDFKRKQMLYAHDEALMLKYSW